jgi:arabinogalactan oligomer/maltooligosaccharide transport system permease protein
MTWWQQLLHQLALAAIAIFVLAPMWGVAYLAFDGSIKGAPTEFRVWPKQFTLSIFEQLWTRSHQVPAFPLVLKNSLLVSGGAALLSVALGASMAYAFARYRFPGRRAGLLGLLLGALLPPVALMVPLYVLLSQLGIRTSLFGLVVVYTSFSLPFCIWNMRAAFQAVPRELEESAFLDGATPLIAFWRVTMPLALPAIAVAALIAFLIGYSEFALGWLFVESSHNVTLAMAISGVFGRGGQTWSFLAALAILMSVPVVVIFLALQHQLLDRMLFGPVGE